MRIEYQLPFRRSPVRPSIQVTYPNSGPSLGYAYDSMGRLNTMTDLGTSTSIISGHNLWACEPNADDDRSGARNANLQLDAAVDRPDERQRQHDLHVLLDAEQRQDHVADGQRERRNSPFGIFESTLFNAPAERPRRKRTASDRLSAALQTLTIQ